MTSEYAQGTNSQPASDHRQTVRSSAEQKTFTFHLHGPRTKEVVAYTDTDTGTGKIGRSEFRGGVPLLRYFIEGNAETIKLQSSDLTDKPYSYIELFNVKSKNKDKPLKYRVRRQLHVPRSPLKDGDAAFNKYGSPDVTYNNVIITSLQRDYKSDSRSLKQILDKFSGRFIFYSASDSSNYEMIKNCKEALKEKNKEALEEKIKEALEEKIKEALEEKNKEALERKIKEALGDKNIEALDGKIKEALEKKNIEALERKIKEALGRKIKEALSEKNIEALEGKFKEALEEKITEALERKFTEALEKFIEALERKIKEALGDKNIEALEGKIKEALGEKFTEALEKFIEALGRKIKEALGEKNTEALEE
ncbi:hypothetical protein BDV36DRAFT_289836, partial [Aspergillus pseudocaelatus]